MSIEIRDLKVETVPLSVLKPYRNNPRTHTKKQIDQICQSIESFGWTNPILVDGSNQVIAGHGRLLAAKQLGIELVPVIQRSDLTGDQVRAYVIADNKLAELAGWDDQLLAIELKGLSELDLQFNIEVTGFETGEIDLLISGLEESGEPDEVDRVPLLDNMRPAICSHDDLWRLGDHRLLSADATKAASFDRLMGDAVAQMVITDPPYNVPIAGHVGGLGAVIHREFTMASGEMSESAFRSFLEGVLSQATRYSISGSIHFVFMDWRNLHVLLCVGRKIYTEQKNLCVWNKTNGGMGSLYRSKHELVVVFKSGPEPHINNVELGSRGRYRTNVWDYARVNSFGADRSTHLSMHPTVKPVQLVEDAILDCSRRGGIVLDPFLGSGTTIIAAERTGRRGFGIEIDPLYVDVTLKRFRDLTGVDPIHVASGLSFSELA